MDLMRTAGELAEAADALAALAAHLRLETEDLPADPRVRALLAEIAAEVAGGPVGEAGPAAGPVVGLARTVLLQGGELVQNPGRPGGWDRVDVPLLQGIGRMSMGIVEAVRAAGERHPALGERLRAPDATLLDVGVGTAWLSVALARAYPRLRLVGIDVFAPALELARANVATEGLADRIALRRQDVVTLEPTAEFDVVWLPLPFLGKEIVPAALAAARGALRPGGWLLAGTFSGPPGRLAELLADLRTVRAGGHPWRPDELRTAVAAAGFEGTAEIERSWRAPVRLWAVRSP